MEKQERPRILKMYIVVRDDVPTNITPTLVAHTAINAHKHFNGSLDVYDEWLANHYFKVTVKVNPSVFEKIRSTLVSYQGYENKTCNGEITCLVCAPVWSDDVPKPLQYAKLWDEHPLKK